LDLGPIDVSIALRKLRLTQGRRFGARSRFRRHLGSRRGSIAAHEQQTSSGMCRGSLTPSFGERAGADDDVGQPESRACSRLSTCRSHRARHPFEDPGLRVRVHVVRRRYARGRSWLDARRVHRLFVLRKIPPATLRPLCRALPSPHWAQYTG